MTKLCGLALVRTDNHKSGIPCTRQCPPAWVKLIRHSKQMGGHTFLQTLFQPLRLYLGTMYQNNIYTSIQPGPQHTDPQKEYQSHWCSLSKQCLKTTWASRFLLLHCKRDAKMGTGRMSLKKAFKGITLGQKEEIKVFRLCQFIWTMLRSGPKGIWIFIYVIFKFIRLASFQGFFFSWQRCICKRWNIPTDMEKAVPPCFPQTQIEDKCTLQHPIAGIIDIF